VGRFCATLPVRVLAACVVLTGCAGDPAKPLTRQPALAPDVAALDRTRPGTPPIAADKPLTLAEITVLALQNSPDLRAIRAQKGGAAAQVIQAGLLPDPVLGSSYGVLLGGPAVANAITASLTTDITALITLSVRRRAARKAALQVNADVIWQEWQTISRAQTLAIDLVKQGQLLRSIKQTLDVLQHRAGISAQAVAQGNATLQTLAPDVAALTSLQTQYDAAILAQEQRWQSLDALLGLEPGVRPLLATALNVPPLRPGEAASLLASLPERRPDLIALQLGYQAQQANLRAAILGLFPALTLGPSYGIDTTRVNSFGPALSITLPLFNRNRGAIAIQRATREQLRDEYAARLATAVGGAKALLANIALQEGQLAASRAGLGQARRLAVDAEGALRAGLIDELSYVQLVVTRLEKERQVMGLEQQVLDERTALGTLLGAGLPPVRLVPPPEPSLL